MEKMELVKDFSEKNQHVDQEIEKKILDVEEKESEE